MRDGPGRGARAARFASWLFVSLPAAWGVAVVVAQSLALFR